MLGRVAMDYYLPRLFGHKRESLAWATESGGRDLASRLADNFQRSNDCVLVQPVRKKSSFVEPCNETLRVTCRKREEAPRLVRATQP
jgi:hypothetical protein